MSNSHELGTKTPLWNEVNKTDRQRGRKDMESLMTMIVRIRLTVHITKGAPGNFHPSSSSWPPCWFICLTNISFKSFNSLVRDFDLCSNSSFSCFSASTLLAVSKVRFLVFCLDFLTASLFFSRFFLYSSSREK